MNNTLISAQQNTQIFSKQMNHNEEKNRQETEKKQKTAKIEDLLPNMHRLLIFALPYYFEKCSKHFTKHQVYKVHRDNKHILNTL